MSGGSHGRAEVQVEGQRSWCREAEPGSCLAAPDTTERWLAKLAKKAEEEEETAADHRVRMDVYALTRKAHHDTRRIVEHTISSSPYHIAAKCAEIVFV